MSEAALVDMGQSCGTPLTGGREAPEQTQKQPAEAKAVLDELMADALQYRHSHLRCGHLCTPNEKWLADMRRQDHRTAEFEVEVVRVIAVARLNPRASLPPYPEQHLDSRPTIPEGMNLESVIMAAGSSGR